MIALSLLSIALLPFDSFATTPFSQQLKQQALNDAFAECFTQVFEEGTGIPASGIAQMSGYFEGGDYSSALLKAAEISGSSIISLIPGMGTIKFAASLEAAIIKLGKTYLDAEMVDKFWDRFQDLSETDQEKFLEGEYVAEIDAALGGYYTKRNVDNLRDLFGFYMDEKAKQQLYMDNAAKTLRDLQAAESLGAPEPYAPENATTITITDFDPSMKLEWYTLHGNIFRIELWVGNQYHVLDRQLPPGSIHAFYSVSLSDFDVDWEEELNQAEESLELEWQVWGARYDSSGYIKTLIGKNFVSSAYDIITLPGRENEAIKKSFLQKLSILTENELNVNLTAPYNGYETGSDSVQATAEILSSFGTLPDNIEAVGFVINDTIEYTTLQENSFSISVPLKLGNNRLYAGIQTNNGNYVLSDPITINRIEQEEKPAWVLREIVPRDMCANYGHQCYDVEYVMSEGFFSQQGNGKNGGPCYCEKYGNCGPWSGNASYSVPPPVLFPGEELALSVELSADEGRGYNVGMRYCVYSDAEKMSFDGQGYNTGDQASYCTDSGMPDLWPDAYPTPSVYPEGTMTIPTRVGGGLVIDASFSSNQCATGYRYVYQWTQSYTEPNEVKTYYDSGALKSVNTWRDGMKNGPVLRYYENGVVSASATYLNGQPEGTARYYYEDGTLKKTANYVNGKSNGPAYYYDESGNMHTMIMYVDGVKEGLAQEYYADGYLWKEYNYEDGVLSGTVTEYNPDGSIKSEYTFINGERENALFIF